MSKQQVTPGQVVHLRADRPEFGSRHARSLVKTDYFQAILVDLPGGQEMQPHQVEGPISVQCLQGAIAIHYEDGVTELGAGDWVYLEGGVKHHAAAKKDSAFLLTIMFTR